MTGNTIETRCTAGTLIVNSTTIGIKPLVALGTKGQNMLRSSIVKVDSVVTVPSLFGLGGAINLSFHDQGGNIINANAVKPSVARQIVNELGF